VALRMLSWLMVRAASLAAVLVFMAGIARAQDVPYQNYLVGDRALGLGGAFVGLADDASATFHNPAGLTFLPDTSISTSFWLVALNRREIERGWVTLEGATDLDDSEITSPPLVVTAVARLGRRDARGRKRHAVGAAVLKPLRVNYRFAAVTGSDDAALSALDVIHNDNARWYGLSYAFQAPHRLSVGISGFLALRSMKHEEIEIHGADGPVSPSPADHAVTRHSVFAASLRHLVVRLGMAWSPSRRWRLGLMAQAPGVLVSGSASNRELTYDVDETGVAVIDNVEQRSLSPVRRIPWELRVGATRFLGSRWLITADIAVHGAAGDADAPVPLVEEDIPRPRLLVMETHLEPTLRAALGGEMVIADRVPVRGGVFGYRSGVPTVPEQDTVVAASDLNTAGASFSVGILLHDGHEVSFGAAGTRSWGSAAALDQAGPGAASYISTPTTETTVLVFISGGQRAAKRLAKTLAKKSEQWILH
jgi:hypothetical protein